MISYATVGANDLDGTLPFYAELLATVGVTKLYDIPGRGILFGRDGKPVLGVVTPYDGNSATRGNGTMIALELEDRATVDAFHAKAMALGGQDEGAPGERAPGYYMSYFRDPEGNKLCACKLG